jgi:hypothetical protein
VPVRGDVEPSAELVGILRAGEQVELLETRALEAGDRVSAAMPALPHGGAKGVGLSLSLSMVKRMSGGARGGLSCGGAR